MRRAGKAYGMQADSAAASGWQDHGRRRCGTRITELATSITCSRGLSRSRSRPRWGRFTGRKRFRRWREFATNTKCFCIWTVRALPTPRLVWARRCARLHATLAWTCSRSAARKMESWAGKRSCFSGIAEAQAQRRLSLPAQAGNAAGVEDAVYRGAVRGAAD